MHVQAAQTHAGMGLLFALNRPREMRHMPLMKAYILTGVLLLVPWCARNVLDILIGFDAVVHFSIT